MFRFLSRPLSHAVLPLCSAALAATIGALSLAPVSAQAAIVEYADIGGFRTFQDTSNGRVWADLDNYLDTAGNPLFVNYGAYIAALQSAGFSWSYGGAVYGLLNTLPLAGNFSAYASIMQSEFGANIELIRGRPLARPDRQQQQCHRLDGAGHAVGHHPEQHGQHRPAQRCTGRHLGLHRQPAGAAARCRGARADLAGLGGLRAAGRRGCASATRRPGLSAATGAAVRAPLARYHRGMGSPRRLQPPAIRLGRV